MFKFMFEFISTDKLFHKFIQIVFKHRYKVNKKISHMHLYSASEALIFGGLPFDNMDLLLFSLLMGNTLGKIWLLR